MVEWSLPSLGIEGNLLVVFLYLQLNKLGLLSGVLGVDVLLVLGHVCSEGRKVEDEGSVGGVGSNVHSTAV